MPRGRRAERRGGRAAPAPRPRALLHDQRGGAECTTSIPRPSVSTSAKGCLKPSRTEGNTRLYSEDDLKQLEVILNLTRDLGVNLAGIEIVLNMRRKMEQMQAEVVGVRGVRPAGAGACQGRRAGRIGSRRPW